MRAYQASCSSESGSFAGFSEPIQGLRQVTSGGVCGEHRPNILPVLRREGLLQRSVPETERLLRIVPGQT